MVRTLVKAKRTEARQTYFNQKQATDTIWPEKIDVLNLRSKFPNFILYNSFLDTARTYACLPVPAAFAQLVDTPKPFQNLRRFL